MMNLKKKHCHQISKLHARWSTMYEVSCYWPTLWSSFHFWRLAIVETSDGVYRAWKYFCQWVEYRLWSICIIEPPFFVAVAWYNVDNQRSEIQFCRKLWETLQQCQMLCSKVTSHYQKTLHQLTAQAIPYCMGLLEYLFFLYSWIILSVLL